MKKAILLIAVVMSAGILSTASAQLSAIKRTYYYYPASNVYYDVSEKQYLFNDHGTWTSSKTLPSGVVLTKTSRRVTVYHPDKDVWVNNASHVTKYKKAHAKHGKSYKARNKGKKP